MRKMATSLALFEGSFLLVAVFGMTIVWERPLLTNWSDVAAVVGQALVVSLCCIVASGASPCSPRGWSAPLGSP